ncbi:MAG: FGGY family carbohydrate kinase, partial [Bacteroidota bacterium]
RGDDPGRLSRAGAWRSASRAPLPVAQVTYPDEEMPIDAPEQGWAEQDPNLWWESIIKGFGLLGNKVDLSKIEAIGISYQMHGLVILDKEGKVLRPSIIWCDSRAVEIGKKAYLQINKEYLNNHLLNSPGNFTASKLKWVKDNQPEVYAKIGTMMLPGDFIAYKITGQIQTTSGGLSEGILWDFQEGRVSNELLQHYGLDEGFIPEIVPAMGKQAQTSTETAELLGIKEGVSVCYRAGDQPNNAFSLNVLSPGEVAATAGTSAVIYAVTDQLAGDQQQRINTFQHVTSKIDKQRNGLLLCINGSGISYSWIKRLLGDIDYPTLNELAAPVEIGADGLMFYPFGNGAERLFQNQYLGAQFVGLDFNRHDKGHMIRSLQEGVVFSMKYGLEVIEQIGGKVKTIRAGKANLFLSPLFREAFVNTTEIPLELYDTDGAEGAARGAALGSGYYSDARDAFVDLKLIERLEPQKEKTKAYKTQYAQWVSYLEKIRLSKTI